MNSGRFFSELKRRNVYKVAVAYAIVGWLLVQIATQVFPFLEIPTWVVRLVIVLVAAGFPIALVIAWAFELTHLATSILERLQERLGESAPTGLRFAPGLLPEVGREPEEASKRTVPKVSEADRAEGARIAAAIANPDLREAVARAAEASLAAGSNRRI